MEPIKIIEKYYDPKSCLYQILLTHSRHVTQKAISIAKAHPELHMDEQFIAEAAMLHDIGIYLTDAPDIECHGTYPYICHGYLGADIVRNEGYPKHALVCERHTGTGLSLELILNNKMPIPHRDMIPQTLEEQVICFADKFYSKTKIQKEKTVEEVKKSLAKFGTEQLQRFEHWCSLFL
ncbi:MAG: HDIG domain-containing protein [Paludibacteraceae bacterium]|nr:HDIG domain-containing protein [Paludibacteraceae bacterium]